jgi:hypothetical protein
MEVKGGDMNLNAEEVIERAVVFLLIGIVFPIGLQLFANANMTGVDPNVKTIFQVLLPVLAVIGLAVDFIRRRSTK